jgi:hypothetical protein
MQTYVHVCVYIHTYIHTYILTHTHIYIHTWCQITARIEKTISASRHRNGLAASVKCTVPILLCALRNTTYPEARVACTLALSNKAEDTVLEILSNTSTSLCDALVDSETAYLEAIQASTHHVAPISTVRFITSRDHLKEALEKWTLLQSESQQNAGGTLGKGRVDRAMLLDDIKGVLTFVDSREDRDADENMAGEAGVFVKRLADLERRLCQVYVLSQVLFHANFNSDVHQHVP